MKDIFFCPEESLFYSNCLENLVWRNCEKSETIVEFGSGDGSPMINALLRNQFDGLIEGFELNTSAWKAANLTIDEYNLGDKYIIYNSSLLNSDQPKANYLVANPPYLPAPDNDIYIPLLFGGVDGAEITNQLLSLNYENVLLLVSSFSNPKSTIEHAKANGYSVQNFLILPLRFGYYSSEPKVKKHIEELRKHKMAFYSGDYYFLAGVLFKKQQGSDVVDLSNELAQVMTSL
ncbi:class I SAM-dependent methyltransferase [Aetokthonos hydrillicola Thurmond2011]|jgi:methylase of polypeptide subunit release factors|uniref:Class I SAM-dependent methyltransferase n=1 Tax=Aetokthonos hydrillicola Thurmond2011 TaxID=2712845 RepID=A0AAP5I4Y4_9CYAN|nr:class I SAM-dependent methyltransferase [Aetokthonos hydrillicola]MBO3464289.1 class I SAM-dependent methyltransferase [Aetokthonos hydrillicola CCALA 1050]MBW4585940.1 class I SAM-dependent methyltransferase [Aetokthonos hydrillicola CCALA 1050]MDR9893832.1 class I SAM-dependent methyltransferase [Aetokthonos hydrillicola Thurmond2011]